LLKAAIFSRHRGRNVLFSTFLAITPASATVNFLRWLRHLGGPGLILLGLLDNSVVPLPGSMDVFVVVLSAGQQDWWPYYALMATAGSVLGGYLTYRLARGEGRARLAKHLKRSQMETVHAAFERWGFWSIAVPALIPPPFPMTPFLIAAGAAQYSRNKFISALILGRGIRYTIWAFLGAVYGRATLGYVSRHTRVVIWMLIVLLIAAIFVAILRVKLHSSKHA
jgi:membrane protein YqaA with SNARE-associated domain